VHESYKDVSKKNFCCALIILVPQIFELGPRSDKQSFISKQKQRMLLIPYNTPYKG